MRIITALKAFFKILFNKEFCLKTENLLLNFTGSSDIEVSEMPKFKPGTAGVLALLQREGRFLDFLQEDLENVPDAQIGAVVKETVYKGCRKALKDYIEISPVMQAEENSEVTLEKDFNPSEIRVVGKVEGEPPFKGTLRHKGWRLVKANLPSVSENSETSGVVCPAEVEL